MNMNQMKEQIAKLLAENEVLKKQGVKRLSMKVSPKGGVSVYGLGRFPVTLYGTQWVRLLDISDEIRQFLDTNADNLSTKDKPVSVATVADTRKAKALKELADEGDELTPEELRTLIADLQADADSADEAAPTSRI